MRWRSRDHSIFPLGFSRRERVRARAGRVGGDVEELKNLSLSDPSPVPTGVCARGIVHGLSTLLFCTCGEAPTTVRSRRGPSDRRAARRWGQGSTGQEDRHADRHPQRGALHTRSGIKSSAEHQWQTGLGERHLALVPQGRQRNSPRARAHRRQDLHLIRCAEPVRQPPRGAGHGATPRRNAAPTEGSRAEKTPCSHERRGFAAPRRGGGGAGTRGSLTSHRYFPAESFNRRPREQLRYSTDLLPPVRTERGLTTGRPRWPTFRPGGEGRTTGPLPAPLATRANVRRRVAGGRAGRLTRTTSRKEAA